MTYKSKKSITSLNSFFLVSGHTLFVTGIMLLLWYSYNSATPVKLQHSELLNILCCFFTGYAFVFMQWVYLVSDKHPYCGNADNIPGYLTKILFESYPYLFTFGKSNSSNGDVNRRWHKYSDQEVYGKEFSEIFCLYMNKYLVGLAILLAILLPPMIFDQGVPSYLRHVQDHFIPYVLYSYLIIITWVTSIFLIFLRTYMYLRMRRSRN